MYTQNTKISTEMLDELTLKMSYHTEILLLATETQDVISASLVNFYVKKIDNYLHEIRNYF